MFFAVLQWGRWPPGPGLTVSPVESMTWGRCHRARKVPSETLIRGPTTTPPSATPGIWWAAGLHIVDARERTSFAVAGEVDFGRRFASGSAEGVIVRFVRPMDPSFRPVAAACW
ncbi:hypothetical protein GCM10023336_68620 [Streptomyces similanensis]|uniref:Uncharacterized protein n=1 Tax=Streptomyces similanensis TaxID=1274988 RepID=A0ABP9LJS1_9ACTN